MTITYVRAGFLSGNLVAGYDGEVDEEAAATAYAALLRAALHQQYPDAEVKVDYQLNATGCLPATLQPLVAFSNDDPRYDDPSQEDGECEAIKQLCEDVWQNSLEAIADAACGKSNQE